MKRLVWIIVPAALLQGCAGSPPLPPGPGIPLLGPGFDWLLLVPLLVAGIWMARGTGRSKPGMQHKHYREQASNALRILNERYAKGEVTHDEYLRIKADLQAQEETTER